MIKNIKKRWTLTLSFVFFIFAVMMAGLILSGLLVMALHLTGVLDPWVGTRPTDVMRGAPFRVVQLMMMFSIILGTAISAFFSKRALKPINALIEATHKVAAGDFSTRVELKGILEDLSHSFNKMAYELSTIETLRSDFINNFSHEFKTPIVSVRGFAKLLRDDTLTPEERREYIDIIIAESERLANLSANILNLSKYENLQIITDKKEYSLDEQIRRAVVLTEPKWSAKELDVNVEMEEIRFTGSEDLMQQVWLNLIDNAIKFSHQGGAIDIRLSLWNGGVRFTIQDRGVGMDKEKTARVFDKFYQGDVSHTSAGNGLGLSIVQRIVTLHGGYVEVQSEPGAGSELTVWMPVKYD